MIENISTLISNSKVAEKIRRRRKIHTIDTPSSTSIEEAKEKVRKVLAAGAKRRKKNQEKKTDEEK